MYFKASHLQFNFSNSKSVISMMNLYHLKLSSLWIQNPLLHEENLNGGSIKTPHFLFLMLMELGQISQYSGFNKTVATYSCPLKYIVIKI
jgi:hypothetical protein